MDQSPLVRETRPTVFKPKVVELYESLFKTDDDVDLPEGFWQEFFLHKPDYAQLGDLLTDLSTGDLVHHTTSSQQLFERAISCINETIAPSDEIALETLTVFLDRVLNKKYASPSSDIISILTGLDGVDVVFPEFVGALDAVIRNGRSIELRQKAVKTTISTVAGAYRTGLISYFINRDLFPSLMKLIQEANDPSQVVLPFSLLGIIVNYNKFEFSNPYRLRLEDFVNDNVIKKVVRGAATVFTASRNAYLAVQDDQPESWNLGNGLSYFGLGTFTNNIKSRQLPSVAVEEPKGDFSALPLPECAVVLATYDFANNNKLFCFNFVNTQPESKQPAPFSAFLSFTSYVSQNAYKSSRASLYACLNFLVLQILVEESAIVKTLCSTEKVADVRLCRQKPPFVPPTRGNRALVLIIMDIITDAINHNLRRRLDVDFYCLLFTVLIRLISFLGRSRIRLAYHWSELWRSCLSLLRFLTQYTQYLKPMFGIYRLADTMLDTLALALSTAEAFLPDPKSYDDLFYKMIEAGDNLSKFKDAYEISKHIKTSSLEILTSVSGHYHSLLEEKKGKARMKNLTPREVSNMIKQGSDSLSIEAKEGLDNWEKYREADHKSLIKKMTRVAVQDLRSIIS